MKRFLVLLLLSGLALPGLARPLREVPSPRPSGWVTDLEGVLDGASRDKLNQELEEFHRHGGGEMAVVVVDSADGIPSKQYAHELFNLWGVGRRGVNDGVLFVIFQKDHRMEVEVGEGCRRLMPDNKTSEILQTKVVPEFKAGRAPAGIAAGVHAMCLSLTPATPAPPAPIGIKTAEPIQIEDPKHTLKPAELKKLRPMLDKLVARGLRVVIRIEPQRVKLLEGAQELLTRQPEPGRTLVFLGEAKNGAFASCGGVEVTPATPRVGRLQPKDHWSYWIDFCLASHERVAPSLPPLAPAPAPPAAVAAPQPKTDYTEVYSGGLGALGVLGLCWAAARRHVPRKCPKCNQPMQRLGEVEEDKFLNAGQQAEERMGSVDYDVWICHACDVTKIQGSEPG